MPSSAATVHASAGQSRTGAVPPANHHTDVGGLQPRTLQRQLGRPRAQLRVVVARGLDGSAWIGVAGRADVVQRQHRAPRANAHALHDPGVVRANIERLQERIVDLRFRMEVPGTMDVQAHSAALARERGATDAAGRSR